MRDIRVYTYVNCKDFRVVLALLWLSQLQNSCAAEVATPAAKVHSVIHVHNMLMGLSVYASAI